LDNMSIDTWKSISLRKCGKWLSGGTPSKDRADFWNGDIPWISAKSMYTVRITDSDDRITTKGANTSTKVVPARAILILVRGSILHQRIPIGITAREVAFNQDVKALITSKEILPEFMLYWLLANESHLLEMVELTGIGAGKLSTDLLYKVEVRLPPLPEQRAIARILGSLDDKIELNRRMNMTLEEMARAIFKSWFVDFDPVHAKAEGRAPVGMDAETAALFPDEFDDSELGEVPKGWKVVSVSHVAKIIKGRSYKSPELAPSSTALVTLKSIERGGGYRPDGLKSFTGEYKPDQVVKPGEMVVACTDVTQAAEVIGRPAIVRNNPNFDTLVGSLDLAIVRPKVSYIGIPFIYLLFLGDDFQNHIYGHTNGTTVLHLDKNGISSYEFVCPPAPILQCFHDISSSIFQKIETNELQSRTLAALRDALLPKLISGKIRVNDAEKAI